MANRKISPQMLLVMSLLLEGCLSQGFVNETTTETATTISGITPNSITTQPLSTALHINPLNNVFNNTVVTSESGSSTTFTGISSAVMSTNKTSELLSESMNVSSVSSLPSQTTDSIEILTMTVEPFTANTTSNEVSNTKDMGSVNMTATELTELITSSSKITDGTDLIDNTTADDMVNISSQIDTNSTTTESFSSTEKHTTTERMTTGSLITTGSQFIKNSTANNPAETQTGSSSTMTGISLSSITSPEMNTIVDTTQPSTNSFQAFITTQSMTDSTAEGMTETSMFTDSNSTASESPSNTEGNTVDIMTEPVTGDSMETTGIQITENTAINDLTETFPETDLSTTISPNTTGENTGSFTENITNSVSTAAGTKFSENTTEIGQTETPILTESSYSSPASFSSDELFTSVNLTERMTNGAPITTTTQVSRNHTTNSLPSAQTESMKSSTSTEANTIPDMTETMTTGIQFSENATKSHETELSNSTHSNFTTTEYVSSTETSAEVITEPVTTDSMITTGTRFSENTTKNGSVEISTKNDSSSTIREISPSSFTSTEINTVVDTTQPMTNSFPITAMTQFSGNTTSEDLTETSIHTDSNFTTAESLSSTEVMNTINYTTDPITNNSSTTTEVQFATINSSTIDMSSTIFQSTEVTLETTSEEMPTTATEILNSTSSELTPFTSNQTEPIFITSSKSLTETTVPILNETSASLTVTHPPVTVTESAGNSSALTVTDILSTVSDFIPNNSSVLTNNTNTIEATTAEDITTELFTTFFATTPISEPTTDKTNSGMISSTAADFISSTTTFETPTVIAPTSNFAFPTTTPAPTPVVTPTASTILSETTVIMTTTGNNESEDTSDSSTDMASVTTAMSDLTSATSYMTLKSDATSSDTMAMVTTTSMGSNLARLKFTLQTSQNVTSIEFQSRLAKGIAISYSDADQTSRRKRAVSETDGDYNVTVFSTKLVSENSSVVEADYSVEMNGFALTATEAVGRLENSSQIIVNNLREENISISNLTSLSVAASVEDSSTAMTEALTAPSFTTSEAATSIITNSTAKVQTGMITQTSNVVVTSTVIPTTDVTVGMTNLTSNITLTTQVASDSTSLATNATAASAATSLTQGTVMSTATPTTNITFATTTLESMGTGTSTEIPTNNVTADVTSGTNVNILSTAAIPTVASTTLPTTNVTSGMTTLEFMGTVTSTAIPTTNLTSSMTTLDFMVSVASTTVPTTNVTVGVTSGTNGTVTFTEIPTTNVTAGTTTLDSIGTETSTAIPTTNLTSSMTTLDFMGSVASTTVSTTNVTVGVTSGTNGTVTFTEIPTTNVTAGTTTLDSIGTETSTAIATTDVTGGMTSGTDVNIPSTTAIPFMTSETSIVPTMAETTTAIVTSMVTHTDVTTAMSATTPTMSSENDTIVRMTFTLSNSTTNVTSEKFQQQIAFALAKSYSILLTISSSRRRRAVTEEFGGFNVTVLSANRINENSSEVQADFEVETNGTQLSAAEAASELNDSLPTVVMNLNESNISVTNLEIKALQDVTGNLPSATTVIASGTTTVEVTSPTTTFISTTSATTTLSATTSPDDNVVRIDFTLQSVVDYTFLRMTFPYNLSQALADSYHSLATRSKRALGFSAASGAFNVTVKSVEISNGNQSVINGYFTVTMNGSVITAEMAVSMLESNLGTVASSMLSNNISVSTVIGLSVSDVQILSCPSLVRAFYAVSEESLPPPTGFSNVSYLVYRPVDFNISIVLPFYYICALEPEIARELKETDISFSNIQILQIRLDPRGEAEVFYDVYQNGSKFFFSLKNYKNLSTSLQSGQVLTKYNGTIHRRAEVYVPSDIEHRVELFLESELDFSMNKSIVQNALDENYATNTVLIHLFENVTYFNFTGHFIEYTVTSQNGTLIGGNDAAMMFNNTIFLRNFNSSEILNVTAVKAPYYSILRTMGPITPTVTTDTTNPSITGNGSVTSSVTTSAMTDTSVTTVTTGLVSTSTNTHAITSSIATALTMSTSSTNASDLVSMPISTSAASAETTTSTLTNPTTISNTGTMSSITTVDNSATGTTNASVSATETSSPSVDITTSIATEPTVSFQPQTSTIDPITTMLASSANATNSETESTSLATTQSIPIELTTVHNTASSTPPSNTNTSNSTAITNTATTLVTMTSATITSSISTTEVATAVQNTTNWTGSTTIESSSLSNSTGVSETGTTTNLSSVVTTTGFNITTSNITEITTGAPPVTIFPWYIIVIIILGSLVFILLIIILVMCLKYCCGGKSVVSGGKTIPEVRKTGFPIPHPPLPPPTPRNPSAEPRRRFEPEIISTEIRPEPQPPKPVTRRPIPHAISPAIVPPSAKMSRSAPPIPDPPADIPRPRFQSSIHPLLLPPIHQNLSPQLLSNELTDDAMAKRNIMQRSEIERYKNKQRIRRKKTKSPYSDSYRNMQREIDTVLNPSAAIFQPPRFHRRKGKMNLAGRGPRDPDIKMMTMKPHGQYSRIDPHRRKDSLTDDDTSVSDDSGVTSPETTRRKMADLLQDAFSLISPSGQSNLVGPIPPKRVQPVSNKQPPMHHPDGRTSSPHHRSLPHSNAQPISSSNNNPTLFTRSQPPPFFAHSPASPAVYTGPTASGDGAYITPARPIPSAADNSNSQIWTPYRAFDGTTRLQHSEAAPLPVNSNFNNSNAMPSPYESLNLSMPTVPPPSIPGFVPSTGLSDGSYLVPSAQSTGVYAPPPPQFQGYQMPAAGVQSSIPESKPEGSGSGDTSTSCLVQSIKEELAKLTGYSTPVEDFKQDSQS